MNGIQAAFTGRIGKDAEVRSTREGKPWASFGVAVEGSGWIQVALFDDMAERAALKLKRGVEVYVEGRLTLGTWTGKDGVAKTGLSLAAKLVQPMGIHPGRSQW